MLINKRPPAIFHNFIHPFFPYYFFPSKSSNKFVSFLLPKDYLENQTTIKLYEFSVTFD